MHFITPGAADAADHHRSPALPVIPCSRKPECRNFNGVLLILFSSRAHARGRPHSAERERSMLPLREFDLIITCIIRWTAIKRSIGSLEGIRRASPLIRGLRCAVVDH